MKLRHAMLVAAGMTLAAAGAARAADDSAMNKDSSASADTATGHDDSKAQKRHHAKAWKKKDTGAQGTGSSTARDTMNQPTESEDSRQQPDASPDTKTNDSSTKP